jgi:hypothetical protein
VVGWLDEIFAGTVTSVEQIAAHEKCSIRQVNMTTSSRSSRFIGVFFHGMRRTSRSFSRA